MRRVLEPLFNSFDNEYLWSPDKGIARSMLTYLQSQLEESGYIFTKRVSFSFILVLEMIISLAFKLTNVYLWLGLLGGNSHLFLSILVKHLEHKNVGKQHSMQIDIVNLATQIAENVKPQSSVAIIGALADLIKHLRKCIQHSIEASNPENGSNICNSDLQFALENCISKLSHKVCHGEYSTIIRVRNLSAVVHPKMYGVKNNNSIINNNLELEEIIFYTYCNLLPS